MLLIVAASFITFLYLRIATAVAFDDPMSVLACLLASLIYAAVIFYSSALWAEQLGKLAFRRTLEQSSESKAAVTGLSTLAATAIFAAICWLLNIGFSASHFDEVADWGRYTYRGDSLLESNWFIASVLYSLPVLTYATLFGLAMKIAPPAEKKVVTSQELPQEPQPKSRHRMRIEPTFGARKTDED